MRGEEEGRDGRGAEPESQSLLETLRLNQLPKEGAQGPPG